MPDFREIIAVLKRFRRRILLCRDIESAVVVSVAGTVEAFLLLTAWTLSGRFVSLAAVVVGVSFIPATVLMISKSLRGKVYRAKSIQIMIVLVLLGGGVFGLIEILTGRFSSIPREALLLIIPFAGLLGFFAAVFEPLALNEVALWVDRHVDLKERLITALEAFRKNEDTIFSQALCEQALDSLNKKQGAIRNADYWTKTRTTIGAAVIGILAAVSMLLITPLERPTQGDNLLEISSQVGKTLRKGLDTVSAGSLRGNLQLAEKIRRLEQIAQSLQSASDIDAEPLEGKVVELDEIAKSLREAIASGQLDADTITRLKTLINIIEESRGKIIARMGQTRLAQGEKETSSTMQVSKISPSEIVPARPSRPAEFQPVMVYNLRHAIYAKAAASDSSNKEGEFQVEMTFDKAWLSARRQADEIVREGTIPIKYRQLIRKFFQIER